MRVTFHQATAVATHIILSSLLFSGDADADAPANKGPIDIAVTPRDA